MKKNIDPVLPLSFEQAVAELEGIVTALERGEVGLEEAIALYTRGMELKMYSEKKLNDARLQVEKLSCNEMGVVSAEPFEAE